MKEISFAIVFSLVSIITQAQVVGAITPAQLNFPEGATDAIHTINIVIDNSGSSNPVVVNFRDANTGSADLNKDYTYLYNSLNGATVPAGQVMNLPLSFRIIADTMRKEENESFTAGIYLDGTNVRDLNITITSNPPVVDNGSYPDTSNWRVKLITGSNFDFFDGPKFKNFAGEIKATIPKISKLKKKNGNTSKVGFGLQFGIFNYRYYDSDSSNQNRKTDYYLRNPFIDPDHYFNDTTNIIMRQYAENLTVNHNNWGAFVNPLFSFDRKKHVFSFNALLHFETIWRTQTTTAQFKEIRTDTIPLNLINTANGVQIEQFKPQLPAYNRTNFFDAYIGAGANLKVNIKKAFDVFLEMSSGTATIGFNEVSTHLKNGLTYTSVEPTYKWKPYFLTKFQLLTTVAPIDIVFGGEIRKIYGSKQDHFTRFRAFYIGAAISLESLKR